MNTIIPFALALASLAIASEIEFTGNISGSVSADFSFRETGVIGLINYATFYSFDINAAASIIHHKTVDASVHADSIWAAGGTELGNVPSTWYGFWNAAFNAGMSASSIGELNITGAGGFIGVAILALIERNKNGEVVQTQPLLWSVVPTDGLMWTMLPVTTDTSIRAYRIRGTKIGSDLEVTITFLTADTVGVVNYGKAVLAPKALESIIEIKNWPYKNKENTLELKVVGASAGATVKGNALVTKDNIKVFAELKGDAIVDSDVADVKVSAWATADIAAELSNTNLVSIIANAMGVAQTNINCNVATITFKAGAKVIIYDPVLASGESPYSTSVSSSVVPAFVLLLAAFLSLLW